MKKIVKPIIIDRITITENISNDQYHSSKLLDINHDINPMLFL